MKVNGKFNSIDEDLIDVILKPIISRMLFKVSEGDDRKMKDLLLSNPSLLVRYCGRFSDRESSVSYMVCVPSLKVTFRLWCFKVLRRTD